MCPGPAQLSRLDIEDLAALAEGSHGNSARSEVTETGTGEAPAASGAEQQGLNSSSPILETGWAVHLS